MVAIRKTSQLGPAYVLEPLYTYADADYLAGVSRDTSRRWLTGYSYQHAGGRRVSLPPVTAGADGQVSFVDLVEIIAIGRLKELGFALPTIRGIVRNCQEILHVERPLATLRFKAGGREIFVERPGAVLLEVGRRKGMQAWHEVLGPFLEDLDYSKELASRWWPLGHDKPIVVDPEYGYGFPVVANSGVRTEIIRERFQAGDLEEQIARDFNLDPIAVERALQFELQRAA
jgi:uncharacterized protein (DUF433 family)